MAEPLTTERVRDLFTWAYTWRAADGEGDPDLSHVRESNREEFDLWLAEHDRQLLGYKTEHEALQRQLASPPPGWLTFGSHVDQSEVELEFWGDEGGVPIWERPVQVEWEEVDLSYLKGYKLYRKAKRDA